MNANFTFLQRDLLEIAGADSRTFLQGLISQDVEKIGPGHSAYGTLLTPQGKFLHDFLLIDRDGGLLLDGEAGRGEELAGRLSRFKLRANVTLSLRADLAVAAVFGDDALTEFDVDPVPGTTVVRGRLAIIVDPRTPKLGLRIVGDPDAVKAILSDHDIAERPFEDYDRLRIGLGVPDGTRDLELEKSILLESNIDLLNGIDWDKGCYMGQELTARTKYRGLVKRGLKAFRVSGTSPTPGDAIHAGDRVIGDVRSASGNVILASVRLDADDTGVPLCLESGAELTPI